MSLAAASRSELTKQFTTSIWWILALVLMSYVALVAAGIGAALAAVATGALPTSGGVPAIPAAVLPPVVYSAATSIGYVFPLLVGTLMVTAELRHRTLTPTFLATPRRGVVLSSKLLVAIVMGLLFGVLGVAAAVGPGAGILAALGIDPMLDASSTYALIGRMLLAFALWTVVGLGVGALVRNQAVAVVLVLAFTQFIEPIARLGGAFIEQLQPIVRVLPGAAGDALVGASVLSLGAPTGADGLEWWAGGLVLLGYALVFVVLGAATTWRRDVN